MDKDPKLRSSTVILDRPNGRSSKFTLVQHNFGRPNYAIWTKEPVWKLCCEFDKFVSGHAILTKLIGLVYKTLKMIYFSRKHLFSPFKLGFGLMTPKKRTLMAALLVGIDFKNVSLLFEIQMGKITHPRS